MALTRRQFLASAALVPATVGFATAASATTHDVTIQGMAFSPSSLTIAVGDTVRFTNLDSAPHTATAASAGLETGRLGRGDSAEHTFAAAGTVAYVCSIHRAMQGTIVVQA
ncbi:cupredoxin domain-containing protein [Pararhodobacter sp.]|uniref:cupredoxin domain-containing protein n=1 Tax=Pararhodobacter sp. TaxID=2127056 RepID=UPI002AFFC3BD|nr:plastocyanin/azurin family copper-binding protein [Pararhodobacter sp.]